MREQVLYRKELGEILENAYCWDKLKKKTVLITGASGTIGQIIVDCIMLLNRERNYQCTVIAISRNKERAKAVFSDYFDDECFIYMQSDVMSKIETEKKIDYILHAASNTHPIQYASEPIATISTNVLGAYRLLQLAREKKAEVLMFSSVEIYGENQSNIEKWRENDMGYLNCAQLRAGYPESKRVSEALCFAYEKEFQIPFKIVRLARVYGPTMMKGDSKAISQFLQNALQGQNIVLKSEGNQIYSYIYAIDCVSGIFAVLLNGKNKEVYNISGTSSVITLYELAKMIADTFGVRVERQLPDETEVLGFSKATKAVLDNTKLQELGWEEKTGIEDGIGKVKKMMRERSWDSVI